MRWGSRAAFGLALVMALAKWAEAQPACPPEALGTARILTLDATSTPRVGRKQFPQTLPLAPKEVVLTFDDGPSPATTPSVLAALQEACVHATFFLVGRNAAVHPALVRRIADAGQTIGTHSYSHALLNHLPPREAEIEIDRGITATQQALGSGFANRMVAPFFRFPGFASTPLLLDRLARRGIIVFGADLWASDWLTMTPEKELHLVTERLQATGGGILLLHDTKARTAAMLPALLRLMQQEGYRVVHVAPSHRKAADPVPPAAPQTLPP